MNIAIVYPELSRTGGIERASTELALGAAGLGHEVHFYGVRNQIPDTHGVKFRRVKIISKPHSFALASFALSASNAIANSNHDIVQSFGNIVGCDVITAHSCHLAGLESIDPRAEEVEGTSTNWGVADRIRVWLERRNYAGRKYRHVIAVSEGVKQELTSHYDVPPHDITVIPNGVDIQAFSPESNRLRRNQARSRWGIAESEHVVLFVGNEFGRKGLKFLIGAMGILPDLPLKLVVVGRENPVPYMQLASSAGLADRVLFVGAVDDMPGVYAAGDIFVLPSAYEAFPLALLEAAASGLPIIVTRVHGASDLIKNGENGFFVERESYALADAISMLLHNRSLAGRLGQNARATAEKYSWMRMVHRTLEIYEMVLKQKKGAADL